jgi:hypothetical protein
MTNGRVTLAELRREAERVGAGEVYECVYMAVERMGTVSAGWLEMNGKSKMDARRRMLRLLRALPDGALKEG